MVSACPERPRKLVTPVAILSNSLAEKSMPPGNVAELPADGFNPVGVVAELIDVLFGWLVKWRSVPSHRRADDEPPSGNFVGAELFCKLRF